MEMWTHQKTGIEGVLAARKAGSKSIGLTSPTGMGKTAIVAELVRQELAADQKALLYTGRRMMLEQLGRAMDGFGIGYGVRAAGYHPEPYHSFQIASLPTDRARSKDGDYEDFPADLVLVDEGHLHIEGASDQRVLTRHLSRGAVVVYLSATPIGFGKVCDVLVKAGTTSEGRKCGALVRAVHYGPDEPAIATMKARLQEKYTEEESRSLVMRPGIFGRVLEWFDKLNPTRRPTVLFAPGVQESRWFAEQFFRKGVTSASIDGEEIWINGENVEVGKAGRDEILAGSRDGSIQVVCNRFVLREGVDAPWLSHGIFATVFDSLQSYLQAGGRLLRASPGLDHVTIQDHGGNWWRHGSLNEDRDWRLDLSSRQLAGAREDAYRDPSSPPEAAEPLTCPKCAMVLRGGKCPCGFAYPERERMRRVVQLDGTLVEVRGKMFNPHRVRLESDTAAKWRDVYWAMRSAKKPKSFQQAMTWFIHKHGYRPPRTLPYMPRDTYDWHRLVSAVAMSRLIPDPTYKPGAPKGTAHKPGTHKPGQRSLFE